MNENTQAILVATLLLVILIGLYFFTRKKYSNLKEVKPTKEKLNRKEKIGLVVAILIIAIVSIVRMLDPNHRRGNGPFSEWLRNMLGM